MTPRLVLLGSSPRLEAVLAPHQLPRLSPEAPLAGQRLLIAIALDDAGAAPAYYALLRRLRAAPDALAGSTVCLVADGTGELYTKSAAQALALACSMAGAYLPGRPLVEATGSLYNQHIQAANWGLTREETYARRVGELIARLASFAPPRFSHPRVLMLHASEQQRSNTLALGRAAGAVLTVLGVVLSPLILHWMGTPADVIDNSILYFRVYFLGSIAVVLYNMGASILQSVGDSRSPMVYLILASLTNVVLDLLFVAVFRWGVGSAALATILSQILSAILAFRKLTHTRAAYRVNWRRIRFEGPMLRQVVTLGIPSGVQSSVVSLANVVVQSNINAFGSSAMAGCGAYSKIEGFAFLPVTCFALALSTFVSQNIGAQRYDRVKAGMKFGLLCSPLLAEGIGVCIFFLSPQLISLFNDHPEVISFGVNYAHTVALFYFLLAFSHCCAGILRGMGRPIVPMAVMLTVWCAIRITYITLTVRLIPSIQVVYWAYPLTWTISSVLFVLFLSRLRFPPMAGEGHSESVGSAAP